MTKLIMASTADVWLIHLPGMIRKHEVFTAEQLIQDMENLDDLTRSMEDHPDISEDGSEPHPLSCCLFSVPKQGSTTAKCLDFPSLLCRKLKKKASARELHCRPLLVQTRTQGGTLSSVVRSPAHKRKHKAHAAGKEVVVGKQRQSPLSSWIGKQLVGQKVPNKYLDKDGHLQMMEGYPHGLLAIPSDGYSGQRIVVPVDEQKALIKYTHAEIHHQGHTKVHHVLYPLYYWPGMDATIEAVCTSCAKCIRANRRRKKLNLDFNPESQKKLLLPRQRCGIDFMPCTMVKSSSWSICSPGKQCWNSYPAGKWRRYARPS